MWIGLSKQLTLKELRVLLQSFKGFDKVSLFEKAPEHPIDEIWGAVTWNRSEFPVVIEFYRLRGNPGQQQKNIHHLAKCISQKTDYKTICDGSGFGDDESPYWALVWERGYSFLADDCHTTFGDGTVDAPVRIVREITT